MNNNLSNDTSNNDNEQQLNINHEKLNSEEKLRIIKGLILLLLFSSVVISSMFFYNAPNYNPNLVFEGHHDDHMRHDKHSHENPVYRLQSKFTKKNIIQLELKLERVGKNNIIDAEAVRNLIFSIKFAKNKAKIEISDLEAKVNQWRIPRTLYDYNDFELEDDGRVDFLDDSNIGINIVNHPFSFYLYRKNSGEKLFDTTHSNESSNPLHYLYYAKNYIQISTALPQNHYSYGLGEKFNSLRLKNGKYVLYAADPLKNKHVNGESNDNFYSSIPSFITVNPHSLNAYGVLMFNSSPMEVLVDNDFLTYKMTSGTLEMYVFNGPRPKEIIMQMQQTVGMPVLPEFSALNWQANLITSVPNRDIVSVNKLLSSKESNSKYKFPVVDIWVDYDIPLEESLYKFKDIQDEISDLELNNHRIYGYSRSPLSKTYKSFEVAQNKTVCILNENKEILFGKTSYGDVCFLDYLSPNALSFVKNYKIYNNENKKTASQLVLVMNEPSQNCDGECNPKNTSPLKLPFIPGGVNLEKATLPLKSKQYGDDNNADNILLNTHNIYSLQETKTYYTAMSDLGVSRPLLFSRSFFPGSQQYAGKWLGYLEGSWDGFRMGMLQTMNFNLNGNPNVAHEACGYSKYSPNPEIKIIEREKDSKYTEELCIRWLQFSSLNPFARLNDFEILPFYNESNKKVVDATFKLRAVMNMYIYAYMLKNAIGGGSFIRPMFLDFKSENMINDLHELDSQVMLGSHFLMSPVMTFNQRKKKTYFPDEKFYDFYTGLYVNPNGEQYISVDAPLDKLPLFARAGFVTPIQTVPDNFSDLNQMRTQPVEILLALDSNFRAAGRIYIDDGKSNRTMKKKEYYRMDITAMQDPTTENIEIIFYKFPNEYTIDATEYQFISKLHIFGLEKRPVRIYQTIKSDGRINVSDIQQKLITMNNDTKALYITDLKLSLQPDHSYKLILETNPRS